MIFLGLITAVGSILLAIQQNEPSSSTSSSTSPSTFPANIDSTVNDSDSGSMNSVTTDSSPASEAGVGPVEGDDSSDEVAGGSEGRVRQIDVPPEDPQSQAPTGSDSAPGDS